jgi:hypothetical protein
MRSPLGREVFMKLENSLVGEKTIAFSIAQEILTTSVNIPTIPANAKKILAIVRQSNDQIDIPLLVKLVKSDPGLFTRIMQLANSQFYTEVQKIVSLRAAITRIGLIEIVSSVCLYFFQKIYPGSLTLRNSPMMISGHTPLHVRLQTGGLATQI